MSQVLTAWVCLVKSHLAIAPPNHASHTVQTRMLKVLNHASRTLPRLPYTNLKKRRTEEKKAGY